MIIKSGDFGLYDCIFLSLKRKKYECITAKINRICYYFLDYFFKVCYNAINRLKVLFYEK